MKSLHSTPLHGNARGCHSSMRILEEPSPLELEECERGYERDPTCSHQAPPTRKLLKVPLRLRSELTSTLGKHRVEAAKIIASPQCRRGHVERTRL